MHKTKTRISWRFFLLNSYSFSPCVHFSFFRHSGLGVCVSALFYFCFNLHAQPPPPPPPPRAIACLFVRLRFPLRKTRKKDIDGGSSNEPLGGIKNPPNPAWLACCKWDKRQCNEPLFARISSPRIRFGRSVLSAEKKGIKRGHKRPSVLVKFGASFCVLLLFCVCYLWSRVFLPNLAGASFPGPEPNCFKVETVSFLWQLFFWQSSLQGRLQQNRPKEAKTGTEAYTLRLKFSPR